MLFLSALLTRAQSYSDLLLTRSGWVVVDDCAVIVRICMRGHGFWDSFRIPTTPFHSPTTTNFILSPTWRESIPLQSCRAGLLIASGVSWFGK